MQPFTTMLEDILQRPVIDETGFTAKFDVRLSWIPDRVTPNISACDFELKRDQSISWLSITRKSRPRIMCERRASNWKTRVVPVQ